MSHRNLRQLGLIDQEKLNTASIAIIGCGAIGRQLAIMLNTMGVGLIHIVDYDMIGIENLGSQGHFEGHMGAPKVESVAEVCKMINPGSKVVPINAKIANPGDFDFDLAPDALFCCVDSMDSRELIYGLWAGNGSGKQFIDGRMNAMTCRAISACRDQPDTLAYYKRTIFPTIDHNVTPCTAKATFYNASIAAGLMVSMFINKQYLGMKGEKDVLLNIPGFLIEVDVDKVKDTQAIEDEPFMLGYMTEREHDEMIAKTFDQVTDVATDLSPRTRSASALEPELSTT